MKKLIVANWKALPASLAEAQEILAKIDEWLGGLGETREMSLVFCPPSAYLEEVAKILKTGHFEHVAELGAQDISEEGAEKLVQLGVRYVIIGHSDRRWELGESEEIVNEKLMATLRNGLVPIVCLGERTREGNWQDELKAQAAVTFRGLTAGQIAHCLIAYEPVWAISTSPDAQPDTPVSAVQSMALIREVLADRYGVSQSVFLYGGSVTPENAEEFLARSEISGVLVGGASVRPEDFCAILNVASHI